MKKRTILLIATLVFCSSYLLAGCAKLEGTGVRIESKYSEEKKDIEIQQESETARSIEDAKTGIQTNSESGDFTISTGGIELFQKMAGQEFRFSSGAGAWSTTLDVYSDGSFSGVYCDSDMGDTGAEYPNGTEYQCVFDGQFADPQQVNDFTYRLKIQDLTYHNLAGTEEIRDGIRYQYTDPYGLERTKEMLLYLPGAPLDRLPEAYLQWVNWEISAADHGEDNQLPFYGLYQEAAQTGFSSSSLVPSIDEFIREVERQAEDLEEQLRKAVTQTDMNLASFAVYQCWDNALNEVWAMLKETLPDASMQALTVEERQWIEEKDAAVKAAGAPYEGGTMQALVYNEEASSITKARVYELLDLLRKSKTEPD